MEDFLVICAGYLGAAIVVTAGGRLGSIALEKFRLALKEWLDR